MTVPMGILANHMDKNIYTSHETRLTRAHSSVLRSKQAFRIGSRVRNKMVFDSKWRLIITTKQTNRPNVHNTDIVNRNETDQKGVHDERQQSDQHLYLIKGKKQSTWTIMFSPADRAIVFTDWSFWFIKKSGVRGGTWTHNLFLRRETPYPLGHRDMLLNRVIPISLKWGMDKTNYWRWNGFQDCF